jgi:S-adenosylmethionine synthetase
LGGIAEDGAELRVEGAALSARVHLGAVFLVHKGNSDELSDNGKIGRGVRNDGVRSGAKDNTGQVDTLGATREFGLGVLA